jgi:hypothetical protein
MEGCERLRFAVYVPMKARLTGVMRVPIILLK